MIDFYPTGEQACLRSKTNATGSLPRGEAPPSTQVMDFLAQHLRRHQGNAFFADVEPLAVLFRLYTYFQSIGDDAASIDDRALVFVYQSASSIMYSMPVRTV